MPSLSSWKRHENGMEKTWKVKVGRECSGPGTWQLLFCAARKKADRAPLKMSAEKTVRFVMTATIHATSDFKSRQALNCPEMCQIMVEMNNIAHEYHNIIHESWSQSERGMDIFQQHEGAWKEIIWKLKLERYETVDELIDPQHSVTHTGRGRQHTAHRDSLSECPLLWAVTELWHSLLHAHSML